MGGWTINLTGFLDRFVPPDARNDTRRRRSARILVAMCFVAAVCVPPFALRHLLVLHNTSAAAFTLCAGLVAAGLPFLMRAGLSSSEWETASQPSGMSSRA